MELYGKKSASIPQKVIIILLEVVLLYLAYQILFGSVGAVIFGWFKWPAPVGNYQRSMVNFVFSIIIFLRMTYMMLFLMKRYMPYEEAISVPLAFSLYYIGYALLTCNTNKPLDGVDYIGITIFAIGCFFNSFSEIQRNHWKQIPEHKGKIYTERLFSLSMHINYFGDLLWVIGYAIISRNVWSAAIPVFLFCFFAFYNIPKLDAYLKEHYGKQFDEYAAKTKKFIPFIY